MISTVPSILNHSVILCRDLEIKKNLKITKPVKPLCLYLISVKHFQNTFANQFLKSSITIFSKTLSGGSLQHALHRERMGRGHTTPMAGAVGSDFGALSSVPRLPGSSAMPGLAASSAFAREAHGERGSAVPPSPLPPFPPHFIHYQKNKREKTPKSGSLSSYPSHF